ncbi:hypothetical protein EG329_000615 [Mollisiaceae sp. DMI_Dod_QoI]|nr:hypothetical protein EG329_000615 [Helotiales sp. DMI_Dod_QoI]
MFTSYSLDNTARNLLRRLIHRSMTAIAAHAPSVRNHMTNPSTESSHRRTSLAPGARHARTRDLRPRAISAELFSSWKLTLAFTSKYEAAFWLNRVSLSA